MDKNNNNGTKSENIIALQSLASEILLLKEKLKLRRPLLIEFCGSPKAGKSTTITSLNLFLKRNGFKTKVLTERAGICPVTVKTHPFFNIWTLCSTVAEIVKYLSGEAVGIDIIISDRGVFDALCWFEWLNKSNVDTPYLDNSSFEILEKFTTMKLWTSKLDIVYVFKVPPSTSMEREYSNLLTKKKGSIMNENVLESYLSSIDDVIKRHGTKFKRVERINTEALDPNDVGYQVTNAILHTLREMLIENIGYFNDINSNYLIQNLKDGINNFDVLTNMDLNFDIRDKIEESDLIQPIPIAVITNKARTKVLVVKKRKESTSKQSPEKDKTLLYVGGHIREDDKINNNIIQTFASCLQREIEEELGESIILDNLSPSFLIYDSKIYKSRKHVAICFIITLDLENKYFTPTMEEFVLKKGTTKSGRVITTKELVNSKPRLEFWSYNILKHVFKVEINPEINLFNYQDTK